MESDKLQEIEIPAGLEVKLSHLIDRLEEKEKRKKRNIHISWISGVAASVAVLLSIGFLYNTKSTTEPQTASNHIIIEDPEIASREAEKAILLISANFNKGMDQLELLSDNLEKTNNILDKTLRQ